MAGPQGHPLRNILLSPIDLGTVFKWQRQPVPRARAPVPATVPQPGGTRVRLYSYDIYENAKGKELPNPVERVTPDHSYVQYDDGRDSIIAKGGPTIPLPSKAGFDEGRRGQLKVTSEVRPALRSGDYGRGTKVLAETFIPGRSAEEVARPVRTYSARVNRGANLYGANTNSNSFAADAYERSTGRRPPGDPDTWGNKTRLGEGGMSAELQRSRKLLGTGFGSTDLGVAISNVAHDVGDRLGDGLVMFATGRPPASKAERR